MLFLAELQFQSKISLGFAQIRNVSWHGILVTTSIAYGLFTYTGTGSDPSPGGFPYGYSYMV